MIILLSGKQGSGKTTIAAKLAYVLDSTSQHMGQPMKFAEPLYAMHKECLNILAHYGIKRPGMVKDGPLLQLLGTEWGRNTIDKDIWAKCARNKCDKLIERDKKVVPILEDCRFPNELEIFSEAFKVRLVASEEVRKERCEMWRPHTDHASETALDSTPNKMFNVVIDTSKNGLDACVQIILETSGLIDRTY